MNVSILFMPVKACTEEDHTQRLSLNSYQILNKESTVKTESSHLLWIPSSWHFRSKVNTFKNDEHSRVSQDSFLEQTGLCSCSCQGMHNTFSVRPETHQKTLVFLSHRPSGTPHYSTTSRIQKGKARRLASPVHPFPAWQGSSETWLRTSRTFGGRSAFVSVHQRNRKRHEVCALSLATWRQVLLRWYGHIHPLPTTLSLLHREGRY